MPHSPPPTPPSSSPPSPRRPLDTDSVFGSDTDEPADSIDRGDSQQQRDHHSNLPLVRRQFVAAGYRAGRDAAKSEAGAAQRGFDEGYRVGAALGMRAGFLRGMLQSRQQLTPREESTDSAEALSVESLVSDLQQRGLLGRDEQAAEVLLEIDDDDDDSSPVRESEEKAAAAEEEEEEWRVDVAQIDALPALQQASRQTRQWFSGRFGDDADDQLPIKSDWWPGDTQKTDAKSDE